MSISLNSALQYNPLNSIEPSSLSASQANGETFTVTIKSVNRLDAKEISDKILMQVGYTAKDIEAYKEKFGTDPRQEIHDYVQKCLSDPSSVKKGNINKVEVNGLSKTTIEPLREFLTERRAKQQETYQTARENALGLAANETGKQIKEKLNRILDKNSAAILTTTAAAVGTAISLRPAVPLLPVSSEATAAAKAAGDVAKVATLAEAGPLGIIGLGVAGQLATVEQYMSGQAEGKLIEIAKANRDRELAQPFPELTMTAEPNLPQGVPPLIFPPPPLPLPGTVDQTGKVKTVTQTTLPIAPQIVTAAPGRSSQPIPPPPPFVSPIQEQNAKDLILQSSALLEKNMTAAGMGVKPAGYAAHHMVPENDGRFEQCQQARDIIAGFGITVNEAVNGIYLPQTQTANEATSAQYHRNLHTEAYYQEVVDRLQDATTREEAVEILSEIRTELQNGTFPR